MPLIRYKTFNFRASTERVIEQANEILHEYDAQGFQLTLRQLYYQFVARALIANNDKEYKKLGSIVNDARLAGEIDWNHIQDRTRNLSRPSAWDDPADMIHSAASGYAIDLWEGQDEYVEVWVEKDALVGVIEQACENDRVPFFSCRGYSSQSEMWRAGVRLADKLTNKGVTILHLGDHDPSGIDMTRDIEERLEDFIRHHSAIGALRGFEVKRIALTMDQVRQYNPPPNPAKITDSRAIGYIEKYGRESWELDALEPRVLTALIQEHLDQLIDRDIMDDRLAQEEQERELLTLVSERWADVVEFLS